MSAIALGPGPGYKSAAQIQAMPLAERAKYILDLPSISGLFRDFGNPENWPIVATYEPEKRQTLAAVYESWTRGQYNDVDGVAMPLSATLTIMH